MTGNCQKKKNPFNHLEAHSFNTSKIKECIAMAKANKTKNKKLIEFHLGNKNNSHGATMRKGKD